MTPTEAVAIIAAGAGAGAINTVVGSGTLITFPVLLLFGYSPVTANVSNTVGLVPGSISGAHGYRSELEGQRGRAIRLGAASVAGGIAGAVLLLELPPSAFKAVVPVFIAVALVLVMAQPFIVSRVRSALGDVRGDGGWPVLAALFICGIYGGYFGAAQGIIILAILGILLGESMQRHNALKNVLQLLTNLVAAVVFVSVAHVAWGAAALVAAGAIVGAQVGARVARRLGPRTLRAVIVAVGTVAIIKLI